MAIFNGHYCDNLAIGEFNESEHKKHFEYRLSTGQAQGQFNAFVADGFIHEIAVCDGSVRFANIKKTVAYVVIDEHYQDGKLSPTVEKWLIKHTWSKQHEN